MNLLIKVSILFTIFTHIQITNAQDLKTINDGSINDQFEFLLRKSGNFQSTNGLPYEAVKSSMILKLQKNTNDTIINLKTKLDKTHVTISAQSKEIKTLKSNLTNTKATLDKTNQEKNNMSLFGMQMSKGSYNTMMWSIVGLLVVLLFMFIYKFKNSNTITKAARQALEDTELQFEEHRRVALEREQKVRRQLQDEINKQKGTN
ncbi:MAG: tRNA (guanine-N1)-methyltransferase [Flavobacteriaceae bacterium]|nr:tRNA (guanine-N1)-methyltransferase [Flavobacteriaceae bacterium]